MGVPPPAPDSCTDISPECPVQGTIYGYYPSLAANAFFAAFFGLCMLIHLGLGLKFKTWTFMIACCLGCCGELVGYIGRLIMNNNPYDNTGFVMQICCLIIAPAFFSAGIYVTLKHIVIIFGEAWSRLRPIWYTRIFITCDLLSLIFQGVGGGMAATADWGTEELTAGTDLMITGVVIQVFTLAIFGYLLTEYSIRTYHRREQLSEEALALYGRRSFRYFMYAIIVAYWGIMIRCIYRIPELAAGWRSEIMRDEPSFIALEGGMIVVSVLALTIFHPGWGFPALGQTVGRKENEVRGKSMDETSDLEMMADRA